MDVQFAGSCLCGEVRYTVDGSFERFYLCHCTYCRKDTGSAHAANLFSSSAKLTWLCGQGAVRTYRLPATRHIRSFCATCGSGLPYSYAGTLVVPAGSLDSNVPISPDGNIFTASRAAWDHDLNMAPDYAFTPA